MNLQMSEKPGAQTPWSQINRILPAEERFEVHAADWKGYLFAPSQPSSLTALLYLIRQDDLKVCIDHGNGNKKPLHHHHAILSTRAFVQKLFHEQGIVEVGAGCTLGQLNGFLLEKKQKPILLANPWVSTKSQIGNLIFDIREKCHLKNLMGLGFIALDGSKIDWGGIHGYARPGPFMHKRLMDKNDFPGILIKSLFKTDPLSPHRLQLAWKLKEKKSAWEKFYKLEKLCSCWDLLEIIIAGEESQYSFVFCQISGLQEEMEAFAEICPGYDEAIKEGMRENYFDYFRQQALIPVKINAKANHLIKPGEYLWKQHGLAEAWLFASK